MSEVFAYKPLMLRYPDRCTMFNMAKVKRIKKDQKKRREGEAEIVSEVWENDDVEKPLTIRILQALDTKSHPWLLVTHGVHEIAKGPLALFIDDEEEIGQEEVRLNLRDHAHRGNECIMRSFLFEFHHQVDAASFVYAHNQSVLHHSRNVIFSIKQEEVSEDEAPVRKKRRLHEINEDDKEKMRLRFEKSNAKNFRDNKNIETQEAWEEDYLL